MRLNQLWKLFRHSVWLIEIFFFGSQVFIQYGMYAGPTNTHDCLNLTIGHMTILQ